MPNPHGDLWVFLVLLRVISGVHPGCSRGGSYGNKKCFVMLGRNKQQWLCCYRSRWLQSGSLWCVKHVPGDTEFRLSLSLQPCKQAAALLSLELPKGHRDALSQVRQAGAGGPHICLEPLRTLYFTGAARRQPSGSPWWSPQEMQTRSRCQSDRTVADSREDGPGEEQGLSSESLIPRAG